MLKFVLILTACLLSHGYKIQPRIVNGTISDTSEYPFFTQLHGMYYLNDTRHVGICGASLLSDEWILTAAHCVYGREIFASFGVDATGNHLVRLLHIDPPNVHCHPEYNNAPLAGHDIALLKLSHPLEITSAIKPIKLPGDCGEEILDYQLVTAIGTGYTKLNWTDNILREAYLTTLPNEKCELENSDRLICTESKGMATPFFGDSGGPLLRSDGALVGTLSKITSSAEDVLTVYTQKFSNVFRYFDWIAELTGLDLPKCNHFPQ